MTEPTLYRSKRERVAQHLAQGIAQGIWPIGTLLPAEASLCAELGVSRHTVRAALSDLQAAGLVSSHQGLGSRVLRRQPESLPSHSLQSISELALYARNTGVRLLGVSELRVDEAQAHWLGVAAGEPWCMARTLRTAAEHGSPIALSTLWLPQASQGAVAASVDSGLPVFIEVQRLHGRMVSEVRQLIGVSTATREQARLLGCKTRDPLLRIQRWYRDDQQRLLEAVDSLHPQDRFQYAVSLRHTAGSGVTQHGAPTA